MKRLRVVLVKPTGYKPPGYVTVYRKGFMPNATGRHMQALTPNEVNGCPVETHFIDEYLEPNLDFLELFDKESGYTTLVALIGTQSHQFQRACDLAAVAAEKGCLAVVGGPHPMQCDTSMLHQANGQIAFAGAEAEVVWREILEDATRGELKKFYGGERRWQEKLPSFILQPPTKAELERCVRPMMGIYPMRGCAEQCSFCGIPALAGKRERSQEISDVIESLWLAQKTGVEYVMFTSDNFNQWSRAKELLRAIADEGLNTMRYFLQCTVVLARDESFWELAERAGVSQIFFGIESISRETLKAAGKMQNLPQFYPLLIEYGERYNIDVHMSNMIGFPPQHTNDIREHMRAITNLLPDFVSCYIVTRIPGTVDWAKGFATEGFSPNLNDYDCNRLTWQHPNFSAEELKKLLFEFYAKFYSIENVFRKISRRKLNRKRTWNRLQAAAFNRYCALRKVHPMSGGVWRILRDHESSYLDLRKKIFGYRYFPLPKNRELSEPDREMNRLINPDSIARLRIPA